MATSTKHLCITGKVQGVYYRAWTVKKAQEIGLNGWVRNRQDGSVEALVQGDEEDIQALIEACHDGPPAARVDNIEVEKTPAEENLTGFNQRPTV